MIKLLDDALLDALCAAAEASPRRRKNHNLHPNDNYPAHRLLNAVQTDSYIAPHRHLDPNKDETFVVLRGALGVLLFDDTGAVTYSVKVGVGESVVGLDIPHSTWHTAVGLVPNTVILEAKSGPYIPATAEEKAPWAPAEGSAEAKVYLEKLRSLLL